MQVGVCCTLGKNKLKSEFDFRISSSKFCNKDIAILGIKESRLLLLKYASIYTNKIIDM